MLIDDFIQCDSCGFRFEKGSIDKYCSNCFACTGCEIYYCPSCEEEVVINPVNRIRRSTEGSNEAKENS